MRSIIPLKRACSLENGYSKKRFLPSVVLLFSCVAISACTIGPSPFDEGEVTTYEKPSYFSMQSLLPRAARKNKFANTPSGDDPYSVGWRDGCDSIVSVVGSGTYQMITPKFPTEKLTNDPWYLRGYRDGTSWCTFRLDWYIM